MSTPYCRYIKTTGHRCAAFAVRGHSFCYFHRASNDRHRAVLAARPRLLAEANPHDLQLHTPHDPPAPLVLNLPRLEDLQSIQVASSLIFTALGEGTLDLKRAAVMLYNLQVARSTIPADDDSTSAYIVRDIVLDDAGNELAPDEHPEEVLQRDEILAAIAQRARNSRPADPEDDYLD